VSVAGLRRGVSDRPIMMIFVLPHGLVTAGNETVKIVGFFSESEIISSFDEPVQPFGIAVLNQVAPAPAPASA
jgi:hypothetical protein